MFGFKSHRHRQKTPVYRGFFFALMLAWERMCSQIVPDVPTASVLVVPVCCSHLGFSEHKAGCDGGNLAHRRCSGERGGRTLASPV